MSEPQAVEGSGVGLVDRHVAFISALRTAGLPVSMAESLDAGRAAAVIDLIDRPTEKPWGAGEPTAAVVPSAISNAIFDATGARLRSVPFKREKVKAALRELQSQ